jgi:hypothetical protein
MQSLWSTRARLTTSADSGEPKTLSVHDSLGRGARVDGAVHQDLTGGQAALAVVRLHTCLHQVAWPQVAELRAPAGDHQSLTQPHAHVAGMRAHEPGKEAVSPDLPELPVNVRLRNPLHHRNRPHPL